MDVSKAIFKPEKHLQYLKNKQMMLEQLAKLKEKASNILPLSDKEEETVNLLKAADDIIQEINNLDSENSADWTFLESSAGKTVIMNSPHNESIEQLNMQNENLLHSLRVLNQSMLRVAFQRKDEFRKGIQQIKNGMKINNAYNCPVQLDEGIFIDYKK